MGWVGAILVNPNPLLLMLESHYHVSISIRGVCVGSITKHSYNAMIELVTLALILEASSLWSEKGSATC